MAKVRIVPVKSPEPGWVDRTKKYFATKNNFEDAPVTAISLHFLAPNGFEYHYYHYLETQRTLELNDFHEMMEQANEKFGLEIDAYEDTYKQKNSESDS